MSEKPFWEGKTCTEMADLHVKVTFKDGTVATGVTDANGDIKRVFPLSNGSGYDKFIPRDYIESIELLDDPEYERIDNIEDVREGDVYVGTDGNRYTVLQRTTSNLQPLKVAVINTTFYPHRSYFGYALRPIAGATRRPTNEEIVAGAKAFYEALKPDSYPQWDSDCVLRAEYYDAMRLAVKAMQGKATEE